MPVVLVTLGRLPKALDLIRSFHEFGWRVIVADPYHRHVASVSRALAKSYHVPAPVASPDSYRKALRDIIEREDVDLVLPISEDILYVSALRDHIPSHIRLVAMPPDLISHIHDKYEFIMLAREIGLSVPETALIAHQHAEDIAARRDFIVKPRHSCAGYGVSRHPRGSALPQRSGAIVQGAVDGQEFSTCAFAVEGKLLGQAIYRGTLFSGTVAIGFERVDHPKIDAWVAGFVVATKWSGFISFDFIVDQEGVPFAIECNPRTTSGLHFFNRDDLAKAILEKSTRLRFRKQKRLIQFWSVMQHFYDHFGDLGEMKRAIRHLLTFRDVTFSWRDPLPLLAMPWTAREIMKAAKTDGVPFGIAATRDFNFPPEKDRI